MSKERKDLWSGAFFILLSVLYLIGSLSIQNYSGVYGANSFGSAVVPRVVGVLVLGLSVLLVVQSRTRVAKSHAASGDETAEESMKQGKGEKNSAEKVNKRLIVVSLLLMVFYTLLLERIGFIVMTSVYLISQILFLTKDKLHVKYVLLVALLSVGFSVVVYFLFVKGFALLLPAGILG